MASVGKFFNCRWCQMPMTDTDYDSAWQISGKATGRQAKLNGKLHEQVDEDIKCS